MEVPDDALFKALLAHAGCRVTVEALSPDKKVIDHPQYCQETVAEVRLCCQDCGVTLLGLKRDVFTLP